MQAQILLDYRAIYLGGIKIQAKEEMISSVLSGRTTLLAGVAGALVPKKFPNAVSELGAAGWI